jgi:hypothetical protein
MQSSDRAISDVSERTPLVRTTSTEKADSNARLWTLLLLPPIFLFVLGTTILSWCEKWTPLTSAYVVTQIVTTIGYGDFTVESSLSKLFVAFFSLLALVFIAYAIGYFCESLTNRQSDSIRAHLRTMEVYCSGAETEKGAKQVYGQINEMVAAVAPAVVFILFGTLLFRYLEHCTCGVEGSGERDVSQCNDADYESCVASGGYTKNMVDAFYMSVVTMTTIGFGDFQPRTSIGRFIAIPWMVIGVAITGNGITTLASYFYESRKSEQRMAADAVTSIDREVFRRIDRDGNGYLDKAEFLAYTLLKYEVVSEELLEEIFHQYDQFKGADDRRVSYNFIHERQMKMLLASKNLRDRAGNYGAGPENL